MLEDCLVLVFQSLAFEGTSPNFVSELMNKIEACQVECRTRDKDSPKLKHCPSLYSKISWYFSLCIFQDCICIGRYIIMSFIVPILVILSYRYFWVTFFMIYPFSLVYKRPIYFVMYNSWYTLYLVIANSPGSNN